MSLFSSFGHGPMVTEWPTAPANMLGSAAALLDDLRLEQHQTVNITHMGQLPSPCRVVEVQNRLSMAEDGVRSIRARRRGKNMA